MRPTNLSTKIFLDGGDQKETREIIEVLGFLDGQTTNPTLIAKNPEAKARLERGEKFTEREIYDFYRGVVQEISAMIPDGSVSIEVYADVTTHAKDMLEQAREMYGWIPNPAPSHLGGRRGAGAHIKFPTTVEGLKAAAQSVAEGMQVNMTLCFSQAQAAAVHAATLGAKKGQVFISPFVGRLDDKGENGMDLIKNILQMYRAGDGDAERPQSHAKRGGHVEVLTASVRTMDHFMYALALKSDIITAPGKILREWAEKGMPIPAADYEYNAGALKPLLYQDIDLAKPPSPGLRPPSPAGRGVGGEGRPWSEYDIAHELTDAGIEKFSADWNNLIKS